MNPLKGKKGFTMVELLTVVAILGILVLIAAPKFLGYNEKAHVAHIKADVKILESEIDAKSLDLPDLSKDWKTMNSTKMENLVKKGKVYDKKGKVTEDRYVNQKYLGVEYDELSFKSNLTGEFVFAEDEKVYYIDSFDPSLVKSEEYTDSQKADLAEEDEFIWIKDENGYYSVNQKEIGYYWYAGSRKTVTIPEKIKGEVLTSYYFMFSKTNVEKVISNNLNVKDLTGTFANSAAANLDLSEFNVSSVESLYSTFYGSQATNLNIANWDVSNVYDLSGTFYGSQAKNLDVSKWHTSNVTTMYSTFYTSKSTTIDVSKWNTSKVNNMRATFYGTIATTLDVSKWDTSNVTTMYSTFYGTKATVLDVSKWNTSNVTDMSYMFYGVSAPSGPLENFNTSKVTAMRSMFYSSSIKTLNLSEWDTSKVTDFSSMFMTAQATEINTSGWNTSSATDMYAMFSEVKDTTLDVTSFDVSHVTDFGHMFSYNPNLKVLDLTSFGDFSKVEATSMFQFSTRLQDVYVSDSTVAAALKTKFALTNVFKVK